MTLYITRHGETTFNAEGRYAGSTDVDLSETGISQARELAEKLAGLQIAAIVSSPLLRARKTAEIIAAGRYAIRVMEEFAERDCGVYEGLTRQEAKRQYPQLWASGCTRLVDGAPAGGETIRTCDDRVGRGLARLKREFAPEPILLVSHAFVSRTIHRRLMKRTFEEMHEFTLNYCEIAQYEL
jgi:broad specificity phosphatase PhoE